MPVQDAAKILELLKEKLPEIRTALGPRWPAMANQIQQQAESFRQLREQITAVDETIQAEFNPALDKTANQLLLVLLKDETAKETIIQPSTTSWERIPNPEPSSAPTPNSVANRFYLLCDKIDKATEYGDIEMFLKQAETTNQAVFNKPGQEIAEKTNQEK